jgi:hypothetical protein
MNNMNSMFGMINIAIGAFALYSAIAGKGPAYKNDYPEEIKEEANKLMRMICWVVGPILIVQGVLDYMGYTTASMIMMIPVFGAIVVYLVIFFKRFRKILKKKD